MKIQTPPSKFLEESVEINTVLQVHAAFRRLKIHEAADPVQAVLQSRPVDKKFTGRLRGIHLVIQINLQRPPVIGSLLRFLQKPCEAAGHHKLGGKFPDTVF